MGCKKNVFEGGVGGQRGKSSQNAIFLGKRHDNQNLNLQMLLSRNVVVIAQAPFVTATMLQSQPTSKEQSLRTLSPT